MNAQYPLKLFPAGRLGAASGCDKQTSNAARHFEVNGSSAAQTGPNQGSSGAFAGVAERSGRCWSPPPRRGDLSMFRADALGFRTQEDELADTFVCLVLKNPPLSAGLHEHGRLDQQ